ncbi:P-loop containing nucleoside triphosphate hydrolase protein [Epithele typhae]|uniref:P-loop containing nucleoside triphosphate hydrolase protein n=1 Tax=Epithele typhae TaxID=378194 RepID=UPI002008EB0F|nr:P-loop containing nucleoside triphosphate hydrolase protein [Epithele typhae]KAH9935997.1 P-loop containing nucleoside triphosphate hydrolase protein [Epithele typhae]
MPVTSTNGVFGDPRSAQFLAAAQTVASIPAMHGRPEVPFWSGFDTDLLVTGRANAGKSTLLNAVLGRRDLLHTSKKPGRTKTLNWFRVGPDPGHLILVDAPGYGDRGRPEWGELFDHYVQNREVLRRVYILFNANHGLNEVDKMMLQSLDEQCQASSGLKWTLQAIITKTDTVPVKQLVGVVKTMYADIFKAAPTCLYPLLTSAYSKPHYGVDRVRRSMVEACGLEGVGKTGSRPQ